MAGAAPVPFRLSSAQTAGCDTMRLSENEDIFEWATSRGIETFCLSLTGSDVEERGLRGTDAIAVDPESKH